MESANTQRQQPQHLLTVCTAENVSLPPPFSQDPIPPAHYLNCVKLDDYEAVNIAWPLTKDQTDFAWNGLQAFYVVPSLRAKTCEPRYTLLCSWSLNDLKLSRLADERQPHRCKSLPHFFHETSLLIVNRGFSSLASVLHRFILELTCVSVATSLNSDR